MSRRFIALACSLFLAPAIAASETDPTATDTNPDAAATEIGTDTSAPPSGFVPPEPLDEIIAVYPPEAFGNNIEATVGLTLFIDEEGNVVKTEITKPAEDGQFEFDRNAEAAFASARFKPAMQDGTPIAVKLGVEYIYEIHCREPTVKESVEAEYPEAALRLGITDSTLAELDRRLRRNGTGSRSGGPGHFLEGNPGGFPDPKRPLGSGERRRRGDPPAIGPQGFILGRHHRSGGPGISRSDAV